MPLLFSVKINISNKRQNKVEYILLFVFAFHNIRRLS